VVDRELANKDIIEPAVQQRPTTVLRPPVFADQ
jgi:hypothetical protein